MKKLTLLFLITMTISCTKKETVDTIIINANIYTVNENFDRTQAFAIKNGIIHDIGSTLEIEAKYTPEYINDVQGKTVLPGFIDAHCHFLA